MKKVSNNMTNTQINFLKESITMTTTTTINTNTVTTNETIPNMSDLTQFDFQDMPEIARLKSLFPFCKTAKVGNLFYPVITNEYLMDFIVLDATFVEAARIVKSNAINPSGSEHGVVKKVCDMIIDYPSFRQIIRQDLLQGGYCPEKITSDPLFTANNMTLPRGFKYTMNQIVQTMIMRVVQASIAGEFTMSLAWGNAQNIGVSTMIKSIGMFR